MKYLKFLLFLELISFNLQKINDCAVSVESCLTPGQSTTTGIENCYTMNNDKCADCDGGYALSFDKKSCVPF